MFKGAVQGPYDQGADRGCIMLIYKALSAVAAMAVGATVVLALPGFSPMADASTPAPVAKSDRLDVRPVGKDCTQQAWPYYETGCLRDRKQVMGQARTVRVVTTDRVAAR
jgi:hypothetical protein